MIPLDRVRELLAAATPGPWAADYAYGDRAIITGGGPRALVVPWAYGEDLTHDDAALIAAAPDLARDVLALADALATAERERDAARAEAAGLRAIVEGRTVPTPQEAEAHAIAHPVAFGAARNGAPCDAPVGLWLCVVDGEGVVVRALAREDDDEGPYLMAWSEAYGWCGAGDIRRAWPLDRTGRPCPWPVTT